MRHRRQVLGALVGTLLLFSGAAQAQQASRLLSLTLPAGPGPHPAVILLHGCSGILDNQPMWQQFLRDRGYASANVDSFTLRRVSEICTDFTRVRMPDRVRDAYDALVEMADRPDIDAQRIAVMGFSNGGVATLAALTRAVESQLMPGSPRFRAGVAVYPDCALTSPRFYAPILTLIGELDDWTPAAECVTLGQKIAPGRPAFTTNVLPKAHHAFDNLNQPYHYDGNARNLHKHNGYGATVEGNRAATELARQAVEIFLKQALVPAEGR